MNAELTISNIYWNKGLSNFFFRDQALNTLEELVNKSTMSAQDVLWELDDQTSYDDIDDIEEMFYSESVEDIAERYGIELEEEEDEV